MAKKPTPRQPRIANRRARHNYHVLLQIEAGIALTGTEVKSLRAGNAQITEAFARIHEYKVTLYGAQIDRYPQAADRNHDPQRKRRLLLHRREIRKLASALRPAGTTLIPLSLYFNDRGLAKVELAVAVGKKQHDHRQDLKKREHQREMSRAMKRRG